MRLHSPTGGDCTPELCGGTRLDPCGPAMKKARSVCHSVYVIGGAATGKSTFMSQLLDRVAESTGPLEELHALRNKKALVTLRGHSVKSYAGTRGLYLGHLRESFPGTDGLDRASSPTGEEWLIKNRGILPPFILAEGATLATRRFLTALKENTTLLLVYLVADDFVKELRCLERGSEQDEKFIAGTATRSENLFCDITKGGGVWSIQIDSADPLRWDVALRETEDHLMRNS